MPIKLLDPQVVARIAAGEVIERPASVVKELVENALDAGASQISVEVRGGGVSLLRVTDDGAGIPAAEVELAFQRHATSKIVNFDDLESITTLGFRGEALPSIAAVARVEVLTCARGESVGSYLSMTDGISPKRGKQGRSTGTTITVHNLFQSLPARLKFLKSAATENSHLASVVSQYALAFPEVRFSLSVEGRPVLNTPGNGQLSDAVTEVYGLDIARNLLTVDSRQGGWEGGTASLLITGMVGSPAVSRASRDYLSFFVNRRWINSRLLAWAVEEAYHGMLMTGKHPVAIINISAPVGELDVNVHPAKTEVKFVNEHSVFSSVQKAVRRALIETAPVAKIEEVATTYRESARSSPTLWPSVSTNDHSSLMAPPGHTPVFSLPALRLLGQLAASYIVAEGPDGLYLIDQHAAHERILFEKFQHQLSRQEVEVQGLLEPVTLQVNPAEDEVLQTYYPRLAKFGFYLEPFGERTYLVRTVPLGLHDKDWGAVLKELWDAAPGGSKADWTEKLAISIACHSAVRAGQVLTDDEMRELLRQLEQAAVPNTCPHGRPTMTHLSAGQLEREFGRRG